MPVSTQMYNRRTATLTMGNHAQELGGGMPVHAQVKTENTVSLKHSNEERGMRAGIDARRPL